MISNNIMMKERFQRKGENFPRTEENFSKENYVYKASKNAAVEKTDETQENKNFPVILIDEEETIFIEVESN